MSTSTLDGFISHPQLITMDYHLRETTEREIKLSVGPRFRLSQLPGRPIPIRRFTSTYYDTSSYRLARLGITLRRRVEHGVGLWQLKLPAGKARLELEIRGGPTIIPGPFLDLLFAVRRDEDLVSIAKLQTRRTGTMVEGTEGPLAEVVFDRVVLRNGRGSGRRFSEIEIELKGGDEATLAQIDQTLRKAGAHSGDPRPKVFQALDLTFPEETGILDSTASSEDQLKSKLAQQVKTIILHDPGTRLGKDSEELHQIRVAVRRLRAFLRMGRPFLALDWVTNLREELSWLGGALGPARDFDVLLENLRREVSSLRTSDHQIFQRLLAKLENQQSVARAEMLDTLRSTRYLQLMNRLDEVAFEPPMIVSDMSLPDLAGKEFQKLKKTVKKLGWNGPDAHLHAIRIKAKRARYATELAADMMGKMAANFLREIKKFLDLLGHHQDAVVTEIHLRHLLDQSRSTKAAFTIGQIVERFRMHRESDRAQLSQQWQKLKKRARKAWPVSQLS